MQYKIPQNVQIEDKIVGPLTLKQLIILGIGGGITYVLYVFLVKRFLLYIWAPPVIIGTIITLVFTFVKIGGISFEKWILLFLEFQYNARKRMFQMGAGDKNRPIGGVKVEKEALVMSESATKAERDKEKLKKISNLSANLDMIKKNTPSL